MRYIVAKYGPNSGLMPFGDPKKLALFEQAASIEYSNFAPDASGITYELVIAP